MCRPYADTGTVPDRPAGAHCAPLRCHPNWYCWLGKARRSCGIAATAIFANQGPSGPKEIAAATQILRAGNALLTPRDNLRNGGLGVRRLGAPERCSSGAIPRRSFGSFPIAGKGPRRPQAAKFPLLRKETSPAGNSTNQICSPLRQPRGETKFRTKFFCLLFFSRKAGQLKRFMARSAPSFRMHSTASAARFTASSMTFLASPWNLPSTQSARS